MIWTLPHNKMLLLQPLLLKLELLIWTTLPKYPLGITLSIKVKDQVLPANQEPTLSLPLPLKIHRTYKKKYQLSGARLSDSAWKDQKTPNTSEKGEFSPIPLLILQLEHQNIFYSAQLRSHIYSKIISLPRQMISSEPPPSLNPKLPPNFLHFRPRIQGMKQLVA